MRKKTVVFVIAAVASMAIGAALAQTGAPGTGTGPVATACKDDIPKYCPDEEHGRGEVRRCLQEHRDEVSKACREALDNTGPPWTRPGNN